MSARRWLLVCGWFLSGCGDNLTAQGPLDADASPDAQTLTLQERINQAVQRIDADTCFLQTDTSGCEWSDFEVGPAHFNMAVSTGEAILVVDGFGVGLYPQFVRY